MAEFSVKRTDKSVGRTGLEDATFPYDTGSDATLLPTEPRV